MSTSIATAGPSDSTPDGRLDQARRLQAAARRGADWFFWIAGLSVINSVVSLINVHGMLPYIFFSPQLLGNNLASSIVQLLGIGNWGPGLNLVVQGFSLLLAALFAGLGLLARRQKRWAVMAGLALYAADSVLMLIYGDLLGIAIHGLALWGLWRGLHALNQLARLAKPGAKQRL